MKPITKKKYPQKLFVLTLCLSIFNSAVLQGFAAKTALLKMPDSRKIKVSKAGSAAQAFREIMKSGRGGQFVKALERELPAGEIKNALDWFDRQDADFFDAVYGEYERRAEAFEKQRFESSPAAKPESPPASPARKKPLKKRRAAFERPAGAFFQNASFRPAGLDPPAALTDDPPSKPQVTTVETENGVKTVGEQENRTETADSVIVKGSHSEVKKILDDARNGQTMTQVSFEEVFNKKTRGRVRHEKKFYWTYSLAQCPDAAGAVEGEAAVTVENKTTIADTTTIAIPAQILTLKLKLKGFVNDEAALTHYDADGEITETTSGFDRAKRLDMIDQASASDGTRAFTVSAAGNKIGAGDGSSKAETGAISEGSTAHLSTAELDRMMDFADLALPLGLVNADNAFASSRTNWQLGFCVEVALEAPKTKLRSGEQISISAETVHKLDRSKIGARLEASGFEAVSPERQTAEPSAQFTLSAGASEYSGGEITVRSVSRRGIGTKTLQFGKERPEEKPKKPVKRSAKKKNCGSWTGKITAIKRMRGETKKPASGRLVRDVEIKEETFGIEYNVLGIAAAESGQTNAFYSEARADYRAVRYTEKTYAAGKMSCGGRIISSTETRKFENLLTARATERVVVNITSTGEKGILLFGSPQLSAERIATTVYETSCPDYDRVNSSVDRGGSPIDITVPFFEIEFELGPESDSQLGGSKTIQNSDGSETIVTWSLVQACE